MRCFTTRNWLSKCLGNYRSISFIKLNSHEPLLNLAYEDYLLHSLQPGERKIMLWQNKPTIVLGRFQNIWQEVNMQRLRESRANVARRESGGGCVYHDMGNINFTFFSHVHSPNDNLLLMQDALKRIGIEAEINSKRHELLMDNMKITGSAFRITGLGKPCYHHCTLLINSDLSNLNAILLSDLLDRVKSHSTQSVRSVVTNLATKFPSSISTENIIQMVFESLTQSAREKVRKDDVDSQFTWNVVDQEEMLSILRVVDTLKRYQSWEWIYAQSPKFDCHLKHLFPWGELELNLHCVDGTFQNVEILIDGEKSAVANALGNFLAGKNVKWISTNDNFEFLLTHVDSEFYFDLNFDTVFKDFITWFRVMW